MEFTKATKNATKLRVGISGAAGSGKTFSALKIATGIGGKIAVIDTERGSASLYADKFNFDTLQIEPPYTPDKYIEAIKLAERSGYTTLIIDSLSHAWAGSGGILDIHDQIVKSSKSGNSFTAWKEITPLQNKLLDTITGSTCHLIVNMRSKMEYIIENNGQYRNVRRVGMAPIQRDDLPYELSLHLELSQEHVAVASKDRTNLLDSKCFVPSEQTGQQLIEWLNKPATSFVAVAPNEAQPAKPVATTAANKAPAEAQVSSPTPTRPAPSSQLTIQDIAKILMPDLKALFNKYPLTTRQIVDLYNRHGGDQQAIVASLSATAERKVA